MLVVVGLVVVLVDVIGANVVDALKEENLLYKFNKLKQKDITFIDLIS